MQSQNVHCLVCNGCTRLNSTFVRDLPSFRYLERLSLECVQLSPRDFLLLSLHLPSGKILYLASSSVTNAVLHSLVDNCPRLQAILAHLCPAVTASAVERLNSLYKSRILYCA